MCVSFLCSLRLVLLGGITSFIFSFLFQELKIHQNCSVFKKRKLTLKGQIYSTHHQLSEANTVFDVNWHWSNHWLDTTTQHLTLCTLSQYPSSAVGCLYDSKLVHVRVTWPYVSTERKSPGLCRLWKEVLKRLKSFPFSTATTWWQRRPGWVSLNSKVVQDNYYSSVSGRLLLIFLSLFLLFHFIGALKCILWKMFLFFEWESLTRHLDSCLRFSSHIN